MASYSRLLPLCFAHGRKDKDILGTGKREQGGNIARIAAMTLSAVVRLRLGMNQHLEQLRSGLLKADFQFRGNVMHAGERQFV
jgi:hypothetical protein